MNKKVKSVDKDKKDVPLKKKTRKTRKKKKKYKFTGEVKYSNGREIYQIQRLSDGVIGGWIQSEDNLSHYGSCWVADNAIVCDQARITKNAQILGDAIIYDNARVSGNAKISGNVLILNNAKVSGDAIVMDNVSVNGAAKVYGNACLRDCSYVSDYAKIFGEATMRDHSCAIDQSQVYGQAYLYGDAAVGDRWSVSSEVNILFLPMYDAYIYDAHICIGCESHGIPHWLKNIQQIGKYHDYDPEMIKLYRAAILEELREHQKYQKYLDSF